MVPSPTVIPQHLPSALLDMLVYCMYEHLGDLQVHCAINFSDRLDPQQMKRAVRLTMDAEPILGSRFVLRWWRPFWQRRTDLEELEHCELFETTDLDADLDAYLCHPIDPCHDPIVQTRIFRHDQGDTLCIKLHHITADAGALKQYAYLLAETYRALTTNKDFVLQPNLQGQREISQVLQHLTWRTLPARIRRAWLDLTSRFWPPYNLRLSKRDRPPKTQRTYILRHLTSEQVTHLQRYAREHGATLNDLMMAAYLRAWFRWSPPSHPRVPLRVMATVDLRRYLPSRAAEALCNLSNFFSVRLHTHEDVTNDFSQTLRLIQQQTHQQKNDHIGLGDLLLAVPLVRSMPFRIMRSVFGFSFRAFAMLLPPTMTNMGQIAPRMLDFGDLSIRNAFLTADVIYPPHIAIGISGFEQQLTLSLGFCQTFMERPHLQSFVDDIFSELLHHPTPQDRPQQTKPLS